MKPAGKKHLKVLVLAGAALSLMLVAGSYVLPDTDIPRTANRGSAAKSDRTEIFRATTQDLPQIPSSSLAAVSTRHASYAKISPSGSSGKSAGAHIPQEARRKALLAYHEAVRCREYAQANRTVSVINEKMIPLIENEQQADGYRQRLEELDRVLQRSHDQCEGISLKEIDASFFELTLRAALDGDLGAQGCFIEFGGRNQFEKPARKAQYFTNAPHFMERGIEVAYWPIVENAITRLTAGWIDNVPQIMSLPEPNPQHVYRAVRLIYYRSDSGGTEMLERIMENIERRYHIAPQEVERADRWAQQQYAARFANTPPLELWGRMNYCQ